MHMHFIRTLTISITQMLLLCERESEALRAELAAVQAMLNAAICVSIIG